MKDIFILNPVSGKRAGKNMPAVIERVERKAGRDYEILTTAQPGDARVFASRYTKDDDVRIFSVGGDGTAFECANGINEGVPLAIIPCGTGNDYFRMILSAKEPLEQILMDTVRGTVIDADLGYNSQCRFLNCTSIGIDAYINDRVNQMLKQTPVPKNMLYAVSAVMNLADMRPFRAHAEFADGTAIDKKCILVAVMNGKAYGNGVIPIRNNVSITDGKLNVLMVGYDNWFHITSLLPKYFMGLCDDHALCDLIMTESVKIQCDSEVCMQSDGETFCRSEIELKAKKQGLKLLVPHNSPLLNG